MDKLRLGIIGCGGIRGQHMDGLYEAAPDVAVTAACDVRPEAVEAFCTRYDIGHACTDPLELLDPSLLDAVSIAIKPEGDKVRLSIAALEAGLHVLAEKPMALTLAEARAMAQAARASGRVLQIGLNRRFEPVYEGVRQVIQDRESFGDVALVRAVFMGKSDFPYVTFMSQTPHTFDAIHFLAGRVSAIQTTTR